MSTGPTARSRYKELKERRRKMRRRQLAQVIAIGLLMAGAVGLVLIGVSLVRSCGGPAQPAEASSDTPAVPIPMTPDGKLKRDVQLVHARDFRPAPSFVGLDEGRLYACQTTKSREDGTTSFELTAYQLRGRGAAWNAQLSAAFHQLGISSDSVVALEQTAEGNVVRGINAADGTASWSVPPTDNSDLDLRMDSGMAVLAYKSTTPGQTAEFRLAGLNAASGIKVWGKPVNLNGLQGGAHDACCGPSPRLQLSCWQGVCAYLMHNVVGLVDAGSGKLLRSYNSSYHVRSVQVDTADKLMYLITHTEEHGNYKLIRVPYTGSPQSLLKFGSPTEYFLLLADAGYVLLVYDLPVEEGDPLTRLVAIERGSSAPVIDEELPGFGADIVVIPGHPGEFVLALSSARDDLALPDGRGTLHRISLADRSIREVARPRQTALMLAPFRHELLVLQRGGQIQKFEPERDRLRRLRKARYELLEASPGADRETLLVTSYPATYLNNDAGAPMQVMVFE